MPANVMSLLFLCRRPPYGQDRIGGLLDMLLSAAAFDQKITLVFYGEGVLNLLPVGKTDASGLKDSRKALSALELYGVEDVCVETDALELHGLSREALLMPVTPIDHAELQSRLQSADQVVIS